MCITVINILNLGKVSISLSTILFKTGEITLPAKLILTGDGNL